MGDAGGLLSLQELSVHYPASRRVMLRRDSALVVKAVDGVSVDVASREIFGLVGESGCGKSTIARAIVALLSPTSGRVLFDGAEVGSLDRKALFGFRKHVQIVFQDPYASLHPKKRVASILSEGLELHTQLSRAERESRIAELLEDVGLNREHSQSYSRELSGGQRQRVAIARAISIQPRLVVLDEPLSSLDMSIRAQILELLRRLHREMDLTYVFISHDLAVVRGFCSTVAVMYLGKIVELGPTESIFSTPAHPYTRALISATPIPDPRIESQRARLVLRGELPSPVNPPSGCHFRTLCPIAQPLCASTEPVLRTVGRSVRVACHFASDREVG
jgi:oligopeptide/dipeptide ABC transporter ATP-binding protein